MTSIVVVGEGECGGRAALALRDRGFAGKITLVGAEHHPPYERPPLSKDGIVDAAAPRFIANSSDYAAESIELTLGASAARLDRNFFRQAVSVRAVASPVTSELAEMLITSGKTVDPAALAQADVKLKSLLAA